jgi:hypothetical protein
MRHFQWDLVCIDDQLYTIKEHNRTSAYCSVDPEADSKGVVVMNRQAYGIILSSHGSHKCVLVFSCYQRDSQYILAIGFLIQKRPKFYSPMG